MREDLKQRLYDASVRRAKSQNYFFNSSTSTELRNFINEGVDKMSPLEYASESYKIRSEENILRLIDAMNDEGKKRRLDESLDTTSFRSARMRVCPLWPFC
jgi:hypothetical protein